MYISILQKRIPVFYSFDKKKKKKNVINIILINNIFRYLELKKQNKLNLYIKIN